MKRLYGINPDGEYGSVVAKSLPEGWKHKQPPAKKAETKKAPAKKAEDETPANGEG